MNDPTPLEMLLQAAATTRSISIGLPASTSYSEKRFPLTPEAAAVLVERGYSVRMQAGAAASIHYPDSAYARMGVQITDRDTALRSDIVIHLPAINYADATRMRRGALLLTFFHPELQDPRALRLLMQKYIGCIALDMIEDPDGRKPFADILSEIDGRAAMAIASSLLADAIHGKGILMGGVAGVVPCEVTIIGSGFDAVAAAQTAVGLGATVRMFDNDCYSLRRAGLNLGPGVITSALHPKVLASALRSADVVVGCGNTQISAEIVQEMKRGVIIFDLAAQYSTGAAFPSLPQCDLALASPSDNSLDSGHRVCYVNAGNAVPRTAAMAMSNTFMTMLSELLSCDGAINALKLNPGLRKGAYIFMGKPVNQRVARMLNMRHVDISILLQFS